MDVSTLSAQERKRALDVLLESTGWHILEAILVEQVHNRTESILLSPLVSGDAVYQQEYAKGEIAGLKLALLMPNALRDEAVTTATEETQENADDDDWNNEFDDSRDGT